MALGKQFEDTYWKDPESGETKSWTREKDSAGVPRVSPTIKTNAPDDELSGHQGLLFHPSTGTGRKDDPLVPLERRETASSLALGLTDIDEYKGRVRSRTGIKISDNTARSDAELLRNSLVNSATPVREIENTRVSSYLNPRRDRGGGHAETYSDTIMIGKEKRYTTKTTPEHTIKVTEPSDTPIHNPKFWDWHDKTTDAEELTGASVIDRMNRSGDIHWHNPETGESLKSEEALTRTEWEGTPTYGPRDPYIKEGNSSSLYKARYDFNKHGPLSDIDPENISIAGGRTPREQGLDKLRKEGFVPNIFPGAGKPTAKVHTNPSFTVERNYSNERGQYPSSRVHTRFVPGKVSEKVIPETSDVVKVSRIDQGTLVHEIGHQKDKNINDAYSNRNRFTKHSDKYAFADPLEEGFADGRLDRYATTPHGGMGDMYEDVLHDPSDPTKAMKTSYGVGHAQWKNKTHKALYAASRVASRTGNSVRDQYPSREEISKSLGMTPNQPYSRVGTYDNKEHADAVNTMALGHMVTTTPSLMKHLKEQGLHDVGKQARSAYIDARRTRSREQNGGWTQPQLPGMED